MLGRVQDDTGFLGQAEHLDPSSPRLCQVGHGQGNESCGDRNVVGARTLIGGPRVVLHDFQQHPVRVPHAHPSGSRLADRVGQQRHSATSQALQSAVKIGNVDPDRGVPDVTRPPVRRQGLRESAC